MERSVADLEERAEDLEREAADLRRENGWLKEIVMLKSKRFGAPMPVLEPVSSHGTDSEEGRNSSSDGGQGSSENRDDTKGKGKDVAR